MAHRVVRARLKILLDWVEKGSVLVVASLAVLPRPATVFWGRRNNSA
ncbi:MAG: hypothetical protein WBQ03_11785 [Candidatus Sulfotelmatobacter sp.]